MKVGGFCSVAPRGFLSLGHRLDWVQAEADLETRENVSGQSPVALAGVLFSTALCCPLEPEQMLSERMRRGCKSSSPGMGCWPGWAQQGSAGSPQGVEGPAPSRPPSSFLRNSFWGTIFCPACCQALINELCQGAASQIHLWSRALRAPFQASCPVSA